MASLPSLSIARLSFAGRLGLLYAALFLVVGCYLPYLPVTPFYYHFGFHALAAAVAGVAGVDAPAAVLWTGQAINAAAALTVYEIGRAHV